MKWNKPTLIPSLDCDEMCVYGIYPINMSFMGALDLACLNYDCTKEREWCWIFALTNPAHTKPTKTSEVANKKQILKWYSPTFRLLCNYTRCILHLLNSFVSIIQMTNFSMDQNWYSPILERKSCCWCEQSNKKGRINLLNWGPFHFKCNLYRTSSQWTKWKWITRWREK